ncbi:MAG: hypothetical protein LPH21_11100 [Shewanella sp.]|nr:hypothetical protein [Shewanella sp.]
MKTTGAKSGLRSKDKGVFLVKYETNEYSPMWILPCSLAFLYLAIAKP